MKIPRSIAGACRWVPLVALAVVLPACETPDEAVFQAHGNVWVRETHSEFERGANQGWIEFDDYVLIVDSDIEDVELAWIHDRQRASHKPVRYVVNTHFHGDHIHGNGRLAALGAEVIAPTALERYSGRMFRDFRYGLKKNPVYEGAEYVAPTIWFNDHWVLDDGYQRAELICLGPAHTAADTIVWLPKQGILFAGDVVANRKVSYLGDADLDSWIDVLEQLSMLPARIVVPGHGAVGDRGMIKGQLSFLRELRAGIDERIALGLDVHAIVDDLWLEGHPEWALQPYWFRHKGVESHVRKRSLQASADPMAP